MQYRFDRSRQLSFAAAALVLCAAWPPALSSAQSFLDIEPREVEYERSRSSQRFSTSGGDDSSSLPAFKFIASPWRQRTNEESALVDVTELPDCKNATIRRRPVHHQSPGSEQFDVLYYSSESKQQTEHAQRYNGRAVPYQAKLLRDARSQNVDYWQVFSRFISVECLPTRFHFVYDGNQRYIEYRLGERAWDESETE